MDIQMPVLTGLEVIEQAKAEQCRAKFIIVTAYSIFAYAQTALRLGASDLLLKPISGEHLIESINRTVGLEFSSNWQVNEILLYIDGHLGENLTLESISQKFYISAYHLSHLFKKHMGMSCVECVHWRRIERAKELYRTGSCDKREAPYAVGFSDAKYFNQVFRKITGMSPSEYLSEYGN